MGVLVININIMIGFMSSFSYSLLKMLLIRNTSSRILSCAFVCLVAISTYLYTLMITFLLY